MRKTLPDGVCTVVCCFVKGFKSYYISSVGSWVGFKSANARAGAGHVYGILIGFTCKTWHCLYKIQCIGINKGTEQQTQQMLEKGEEGRVRESFFLCRFWCQERACAAAYRKSVSGLGRQILLLLCLPANFQIIFCLFCCSFLLLWCVCVCVCAFSPFNSQCRRNGERAGT